MSMTLAREMVTSSHCLADKWAKKVKLTTLHSLYLTSGNTGLLSHVK